MSDSQAGEPADPKTRRAVSFLTSPLGAALLTYLTTGVGATLFSNFLDSLSKRRDLDLAASRRAIESVKSVTDLIFERDTRANLIASSINRRALLEELKERKKFYDDVFERYNSTIQSNLFRIREIFHTSDYTDFERLLEGPIRDLFIAEDDCVTEAYDMAVSAPRKSPDNIDALDRASTKLSNCRAHEPKKYVQFSSIHKAIIHCEYIYSDALFHIVQQPGNEKKLLAKKIDEIQFQCRFPPSFGFTQQSKNPVDQPTPAPLAK